MSIASTNDSTDNNEPLVSDTSVTALLSTPSRYDNIPLSGVIRFVGRGETLSQLHQLLQANNQVAIVGIPGVGKTELALQYTRQYIEDYPGGVCWLLGNTGDVGLHLVEFTRRHFPTFRLPDGLTSQEQVEHCWQHWQISRGETEITEKVLVVLDEVTDYQQVEPYLPPPSSPFKVLMTTRFKESLPAQQQLFLDVLSPDAALELLAARIGKDRIKNTRGKGFVTNTTRREKKPEVITPTVAEQLCEWLGCLPLGLELVGRYLEQEPNLSLERMLSRLQKQRLLQPETEPMENVTAQREVAAAFELSWKRLDADTQELACLLSIFALNLMPWEQVESVLGQQYLPGALLGQLLNPSQEDAEAEIESLIETLKAEWEKRQAVLLRLHLLQRTDESTYQLHPLIRELVREKLEQLEQADNLRQIFCQVMVAVAKQIPDSPTPELIEAVRTAMPHVAETTTSLKEFLRDEDLFWPFYSLGNFYQSQGFYNQAESWFEQCLLVTRDRLGEVHIEVATSLNNLAGLYASLGRSSEAEPLYMQALEIFEQLLGVEHPDTVTIRKNLELFRQQQQSYVTPSPA